MLEEKREEFNEWLKKADTDLEAAKELYNLNNKNTFSGIICFHCQQAIEKYFKAYLIIMGINKIKRTHNLIELIDECNRYGKLFLKINREKIDEISNYAVSTRYPAFMEENEYLNEDIKQTLNLSEQIKILIKTLL